VGRWLAGESHQMRQKLPLSEMAIFASDYTKVPKVTAKLIWAEKEAVDLENTYQGKPKAVRHDLLSNEVVRFLKEGKAQVVHFSCHGRMNQQNPSLSALLLEDDETNFVPAVVITQKSQRGIGSQHPLVFLNACQVGGLGAEVSFVTGWPQALLTMGAAAVIAPLWSVGDQSARKIAEQFYSYVIGEKPLSLGAALQKIRGQYKTENQLTYLAYLLYGDPTAVITVD
jgi:CHAT domain-containing protein